ncbi:MAG: dephospho-CoA kinase [Gammaproteobacteria bacterium]|nr:dephospho-CoA kinase [Gammaproteobacteria bacterium]
MLVIGLTGGIGSGKSTVAELFRKRNIPIIDTDILARELVRPGQPALNEIIQTFGDTVIHKNGELDRQTLARLTFQNESARKKLEAILHPKIRQLMTEQINSVSAPYVIAVIPLLIEAGQTDLVNHILLVDCPEEIQIHRVKQRDNRDEQQIREILNAQASRQTKIAMADDIIENQGELSDLDAKIEKLHQKYLLMSQDET